MTSLTTVLGLAPLALAGGEGSELRAPLAITVMSGLFVTTALTLLVIPVLYSVFDRKKHAQTVTEDTQIIEGDINYDS